MREPCPDLGRLDDCGCCEGIGPSTPVRVYNRPSLSAIAYRVGTHSRFKNSMLAALASSDDPILRELSTRDDDDFSIALIDAWASVADVLTFYQERFANEAYLRPATERLSVLELARLIGYRLNPGVAATAYLAFGLQETPGAPDQSIRKTVVPVGTAVMSTPAPGEDAQTFETVEEIDARLEWNAIRPRQSRHHTLETHREQLYLEGIATNIRPGDGLLFRGKVRDSDPAEYEAVFALVSSVEAVPKDGDTGDYTVVAVSRVTNDDGSGVPLRTPSTSAWFDDLQADAAERTTLATSYESREVSAADLLVEAERDDFSTSELLASFIENPVPQPSVIVFRQRASVFGHNRQEWGALPAAQRASEQILGVDAVTLALEVTSTQPGHFQDQGDADGWNDTHLDDMDDRDGSQGHVFLDRVYSGVAVDNPPVASGLVVARDEGKWALYEAVQVAEVTKAAYNLSAKVTRLRVDSHSQFASFGIETTTLFVQSEALPLARIPSGNAFPEGDFWIKLDTWVDGLEVGQRVAITGEVEGGTGEKVSEMLVLQDVLHRFEGGLVDGETKVNGATVVKFKTAPLRTYVRKTVSVNANVAEATHGVSVAEAMGSGDARLSHQRFGLAQSPLTHVAAETPSGAKTTLEVRVNDVLWAEVDHFLEQGSEDRVYTTELHDDGTTTVRFGDGKSGRRLPTGQANVRATYRKGLGLGGIVAAGSLTNLMARPLGIADVVNPLAAEGAQDPESRDDARVNAPLGAMTIDRVVSLLDFADYSRAFAGIAKARADWIWDGRERGVFVTLAGPEGAEVTAGGPVETKLLKSLSDFGDRHVHVRTGSYRKVLFRVTGTVLVHPDHLPEVVEEAVESALRDAFCFETRDFGQPVAASEVISLIQGVVGVLAVDLDELYRSTDVGAWNARLLADLPESGFAGSPVLAAELLTLDPRPLDELVVKL